MKWPDLTGLKQIPAHYYPWLLVPFAAWLGYCDRVSVPAGDAMKRQEGKDRVASLAGELAKMDQTHIERRFVELAGMRAGKERDVQLNLLCARWAELDPEAALVFLKDQEGEIAEKAFGLVVAEWALIDPEAAWEQRPDSNEVRLEILGTLMRENPDAFMNWFRRDTSIVPAANPAWLEIAARHFDELEKIAGKLTKKAGTYGENPAEPIWSALGAHFGRTDPERGLAWVLAQEGRGRQTSLEGLVSAWAGSAPQSAMQKWQESDEFAKLISDSGLTGKFAQTILRGLAGDDLQKAIALTRDPKGLMSHAGIELERMVAEKVRTGEISVKEAFKLMQSGDPSEATFARISQGLSVEQMREAAAEALASPGPGWRSGLLGIAKEWSRRDAKGAMEFLSSISDSALRRDLIKETMGSWTGYETAEGSRWMKETLDGIPAGDRAAAMAAYLDEQDLGSYDYDLHVHVDLMKTRLKDLPASQELETAVARLGQVMVADAPGELRRLIEEMPPGAARGGAANVMLEALAQSEGHESALRWWLGIMEGVDTGEFAWSYTFRDFADAWEKDSSQGLRNFIGSGEDIALPAVLVAKTASNFANEDAPMAMEWVASLPENLRSDALESAFQRWARKDPAAAAEWAGHRGQALPDGAINALAYTYYHTDRAAAASWAASLPDGALRDDVYSNLRHWIQQDQRLDESEKTRLLDIQK